MELDLDTFWGPYWCSHPGLSVACVSSSEGRDVEVEEGSFSVRILCSHSSLFPAVYEGRSARPSLNVWESIWMKGIQEWNDCWGLSGGDPVKALKQLWAETSPSTGGVWGVLDAAPQARGKFREVFLLNHGSHSPLQPACALPSARPFNSSVCPWPQSPCGHPSSLSRT